VIESWIGSPYRRGKRVHIYQDDTRAPKRSLRGETRFRLLRSNSKLKISLVEATAKEARRHQIRAHAAALGFPLLGDSLYGAKNSLGGTPLDNTPLTLLSAERSFFLHASYLSFPHPGTRNELSFTLPLPAVIQSLFFEAGR